MPKRGRKAEPRHIRWLILLTDIPLIAFLAYILLSTPQGREAGVAAWLLLALLVLGSVVFFFKPRRREASSGSKPSSHAL